MTRRTLLPLLALLVLTVSVPAWAQDAEAIRIREATLADDGTTEVIVSLEGTGGQVLDAGAFTVTEDGTEVGELTVEPLLESRAQPVAVALAVDISGSTVGEPLENAKAAANTFLDAVLADGVRASVIAFGETAEVRAPFSTDRDQLRTALGSLEAAGETALYDGIALAVEELARQEAQRNLVIFSDGADTVSVAELDEVVAAAKDDQVAVTVVGLATPEFDPASLDAIAQETGGRVIAVEAASELSTSFEQVAEQLASQYVLSYRSELTGPEEFELAVSADVAGTTVRDQAVVANTRVAPAPQPRPVEVAEPRVPFLASRTGLYGGIVAAFLALAIILGIGLSAPVANRAERVMRRGLRAYGKDRGQVRADGVRDSKLDRRELTRRAVDVVGNLPKPEGFEDRLQARIEQAGWPMRASEFLLMQVGVAIVSAGLLWVLTANWIFGLSALVIGGIAPRAILDMRISRRQAQFLEQLPDTLQLLSGSLRAGYGLLQAVDTVVQEASEPTATEFARTLTEARLGMPLDDALESMADRVGSDDFRWVVLAITIQRQVGGNLAELLDTVANTLRDREQVRRQIKTLSAEGRLSAVVLVALPFFLAVYMFLINPEYMGLLFTRFMGIVMVVGALVLMVIGIFWMRKLIDIEV